MIKLSAVNAPDQVNFFHKVKNKATSVWKSFPFKITIALTGLAAAGYYSYTSGYFFNEAVKLEPVTNIIKDTPLKVEVQEIVEKEIEAPSESVDETKNYA